MEKVKYMVRRSMLYSFKSFQEYLAFPCLTTWTSFKYLRMLIPLSKSTSISWQGVIGKLKIKMQQWGSQWLNMVERVILINSSLSTLLLFQYSVMLASMSIMLHVEREVQKFLWQGGWGCCGGGRGGGNSLKFHLINWKIVVSLKDN